MSIFLLEFLQYSKYDTVTFIFLFFSFINY
jgi:hypothetical protein